MSSTRPAPELEDEQEVDLSSAWQRLKLRWWLPVGGLVVGAIIGIALAASAASVWRAQTIIYLGQPFAPLGGRADPEPGDESADGERDRPLGDGAEGGVGAERDPGVEAALGGLDEGDRGDRPAPRREPVGGDRGEGLRQAQGRARRGRARASRDRPRVRLRRAEDRTSRVAGGHRARRSSTRPTPASVRPRASRRPSSPIARSRSTSACSLTANLNSVITTADARRAALQESLAESQQLLNLAQDVESSRVVEPAGAEQDDGSLEPLVAPRGRADRLDLGTIAALLVDPIAARRNGTAPPSV